MQSLIREADRHQQEQPEEQLRVLLPEWLDDLQDEIQQAIRADVPAADLKPMIRRFHSCQDDVGRMDDMSRLELRRLASRIHRLSERVIERTQYFQFQQGYEYRRSSS